jgi:NhaA family Na+:H+ antiporter
MLSGLSVLAGIGFTMSIFITNLAFTDPVLINNSKISILISSVVAALAGILILRSAVDSPIGRLPRKGHDD